MVCVLDTTLFIVERLHTFRQTGEFSTLLHSSDKYAGWLKEADRILNLAPFQGNLEAHGTSYFSFLADLDNAIEKGEAYCKYSKTALNIDVTFMKRRLSSLQLLKNTEVTRQAAQQERCAPMGVLVSGSSCVAKSAFTQMLFNYFGALFDLDRSDEFRYVRNPNDEYWSNYTSSKWCIQLDDIAFMHPGKCAQIDPTTQDLLNVVNNVPYVPPQAALEDKGKTPVMARLVTATSNCIDLNAREYFWCPLAVRRRLPFVVDVTPKKEYMHANQIFINPAKLQRADGTFPNFWDIKVYRLVPVSDGQRDDAKLELEREFSEISEFLQFFGKACIEHENNQKRAMAANKDMKTVQVCKKCLAPLPHAHAHCEAVSLVNKHYDPAGYDDLPDLLDDDYVSDEDNEDEIPIVGRMNVQFGTVTLFQTLYLAILYFIAHTRAVLWLYEKAILYNICREQIFAIGASVYSETKMIQFISPLMQPSPRTRKALVCLGLLSATLAFYAASQYAARPAKSECTKKKAPVVQKDSAEDDCSECEFEEWTETLRPNFTPQGNIVGTTEDQLLKEESANVWYNPQIQLTSFDVPQASASIAKKEPAEIRDLLANNCVMLEVRGIGSNSKRIMRGVFIGGQQCLTNAHAFRKDIDVYEVTVIKQAVSLGVNGNFTFTIKRRDVAFNSTDLCLFDVTSMPPSKDITKYWDTSNHAPTSALELVRMNDGTVTMNSIFGISTIDAMPVEELGINVNILYGHSTLLTEDGMCGSICVGLSPRGPIICGLHILGRDHSVGILRVSLDDINSLRKQQCIAKRPIVQGCGSPMLSCSTRKHVVGQLHHKSMFRYITKGHLNIYGSFLGFRSAPKSKVTTTPLSSIALKHYGTELNYGKPAMSGWAPWRNNVLEMVEPKAIYDRATLRECQRGFTEEIISSLPDGWEGELIQLSDVAAVNGLPGVKYIDKISTATSMGAPWGETKKKHLVEAISERYPHGVDFKPEVWERVRAIEAKYDAGERAYPVFTGHLKDEATPLKKVAIKKTRLFSGSCIDWSLVVRKDLLTFIRLVQKNKTVFEAAPGLVTQSTEWGDLHTYLTTFGSDRIVAGDYGKFDKRMLADFILAAFDIIVELYRRAGHSEQFCTRLMCIGMDIAFPLSNVNGDLVEFFGTNPSGHPLTVILNSLVNSLYMRYCFLTLNPERSVSNFKQFVKLITYGDDNTMGVSPLTPWFNHTAIQAVLASIGVEYTMADKNSASVPFINIADCAFLKRRWVWDEEVQAYLAPLEEESIIKSLTVWVPSDTLDCYAQMVFVISSANNEYFFYGRKKFEEKHAFFKELLAQEPYCHYVTESTLPSFDSLLERFNRSSLRPVAVTSDDSAETKSS